MRENPSLSEQVDLVEKKIEIRRTRTRRHWHEVQADFQRRTRWAPLVGVAAMAFVGFTLARQRGTPAFVDRPRTGASGTWALLAALATSALRIAFSPQGRALWSAWRRARAGA